MEARRTSKVTLAAASPSDGSIVLQQPDSALRGIFARTDAAAEDVIDIMKENECQWKNVSKSKQNAFLNSPKVLVLNNKARCHVATKVVHSCNSHNKTVLK